MSPPPLSELLDLALILFKSAIGLGAILSILIISGFIVLVMVAFTYGTIDYIVKGCPQDRNEQNQNKQD